MVDVLKQFNPNVSIKVYSYGSVISTSAGGMLKIRTTSGLELSIRDKQQSYSIGDQIVLGSKDGSLNSVFILRKIDKICQTAVNVVISTNQG